MPPTGSMTSIAKLVRATVASAMANASRQKSKPNKKQKSKSLINKSSSALSLRSTSRKIGETGLTNNASYQSSAPATNGVIFRPLRNLGSNDLHHREFSYVPCQVYVGNGVLGTTNQLYFANTNISGLYTLGVPIVPSDSVIGASYIGDVSKHFARKIIHDLSVELVPVNPSTSVAALCYISAVRGGGDTTLCVQAVGTPLGNGIATMISMSGSKGCPSWQSSVLDLKPFIAGGYGANQNEFSILNSDTTATTVVNTTTDGNGIVPCVLVCGGLNTSTVLQGSVLFTVCVRMRVSYLDYRGNYSQNPTVGTCAKTAIATKTDLPVTPTNYPNTPIIHQEDDIVKIDSTDPDLIEFLKYKQSKLKQ